MHFLHLIVCSIIIIQFSSPKKTHQLTFSAKESQPFARLHGTIDHPLTDFTVCHWSRLHLADNRWGTIFSYTVGKVDDILTTTNNSQRASFKVNDIIVLTDTIPTARNKPDWLHYCATWTIVEGTWEIFANGYKITSGKNNAMVGPIPPNGVVILGQDQGSLGGKFQPALAHIGQITEVHLWDRVLTSTDVFQIFNCTFPEEGNVIGWNQRIWQLWNGAFLSIGDIPCGGRH